MVLPALRKRTGSGNRKGPRRGPAGQPRAQALGTAPGPNVRPEWAVQAASAFPGWHPGRPCHHGSRAGFSCTTLSGSSSSLSLLGCARPFQSRLHKVNGPQPDMPAKYLTVGIDRGRLLTFRPLRLIRRSPGTITRGIATVSRMGNNQRRAGQTLAAVGIGVGNRDHVTGSHPRGSGPSA